MRIIRKCDLYLWESFQISYSIRRRLACVTVVLGRAIFLTCDLAPLPTAAWFALHKLHEPRLLNGGAPPRMVSPQNTVRTEQLQRMCQSRSSVIGRTGSLCSAARTANLSHSLADRRRNSNL